MHGLLDYLNEAGSIGMKATFVLNNIFAREILKPRDIEAALGTRITLDLPYDPFLYLKAVNEGVPIVLGAPRSPAAEQLVKLSSTAFGAGRLHGPGASRRRGRPLRASPQELTRAGRAAGSRSPRTWSAADSREPVPRPDTWAQ